MSFLKGLYKIGLDPWIVAYSTAKKPGRMVSGYCKHILQEP